MYIIPTNPSDELLDNFMAIHGFDITQELCQFNLLLIDNVGRKIYTYPQRIRGDKQWALKTMCLIVTLRNIRKSWFKAKDHRKRRRIFSKMNYIKGELKKYER